MPELPEVETLRRELSRGLIGCVFQNVAPKFSNSSSYDHGVEARLAKQPIRHRHTSHDSLNIIQKSPELF
ncbi:MAG: DNA-formamidopyrimidine glycosylase family protein [Patescibacteria group bacterium]